MPRRNRYKGLKVFTVPNAVVFRGGGTDSVTVTLHPSEPPYQGYVLISMAILLDRPEITGIARIPQTVWFDSRISREAAELYGVIKNLHKVQGEIQEVSGGTDTIIITRPLLEEWLGVPRRTVQAWLEELIKAGHVTRDLARQDIESNYTLNSG